MDTSTVITAVQETQAIGDTILATLSAVDPAVALPDAAAQQILDLVAQMATKALTAWSASSGVAITAESVTALLPNPTPLTAPDPEPAEAQPAAEAPVEVETAQLGSEAAPEAVADATGDTATT